MALKRSRVLANIYNGAGVLASLACCVPALFAAALMLTI